MLDTHHASPAKEPGRTAQASNDPTPTLATAPEGLSARRCERWLDLPPGAWQRRRLFALRLTGGNMPSLGLREGDFLIVEPGAKEQPGTIVVTRSGGTCSARRVPSAHHPNGQARIPTVLELPLRERSRPHQAAHVIGTVLGHLRPSPEGVLRPVPLVGIRRRTPRPGAVRLHEQVAGIVDPRHPAKEALQPGQPDLAEIRRAEHRWHHWIEQARSQGLDRERTSRLDRLDHALTALCECLERTRTGPLQSALREEARNLLAALEAGAQPALRG